VHSKIKIKAHILMNRSLIRQSRHYKG